MPLLIRWGGFAGSLALGAAAYLGGAGYARLPSVNPVTLFTGQKGVLLPICWVVGVALLLIAWWAGRSVVPSVRWALVTVGLWAVPVLPMLPLGSADIYAYACQGYAVFGGDIHGCPWLVSMDHVWWNSPAPYGPLFLLLAAAASAGSPLAVVLGGFRVIALAGLAMAAVALPVLARRSGVNPARAVWTVLACPLVLIHLVSGGHNDALMVGLMLAGLAVISPSRASSLLVSGVLLGLAVAVKATAIVVLPFAVLLFEARPSLRGPLFGAPPSVGAPLFEARPAERGPLFEARPSLRALLRPAAVLAAGAAGALVATSVLAGSGLGWVAGLARSDDTVAWTSSSTAVGLAINWVAGLFGAHIQAVPFTRIVGVAVLVAVLCLLWWRTFSGLLWRSRGGDALTGAGLALAATVLCATVFQPWYAVWPLAVLAASPFSDSAAFRRWVLIPCTVAATMALPAGYNWALYTRLPGSLLMTAAVIALAIWAVRRPAAVGKREELRCE